MLGQMSKVHVLLGHLNVGTNVEGPCSVGAFEKRKVEKKKPETFLSLSLLRCGPDNKRIPYKVNIYTYIFL